MRERKSPPRPRFLQSGSEKENDVGREGAKVSPWPRFLQSGSKKEDDVGREGAKVSPWPAFCDRVYKHTDITIKKLQSEINSHPPVGLVPVFSSC